MKQLNISGETYGRLTAICKAKSESRHTKWLFKCACGVEKSIDLDAVRRGAISSCGCLKKEATAARSITHGHSIGRKESRELKSYNHAKSRCYNQNDQKYPQYGARGIKMCERWLNDAAAFIADMGECPPRHTIDRIDPNGDYEPTNCRWATTHQQARTRTDNVIVTSDGVQMILKDYADIVGVNYKSLHAKIKYRGKTLEQATQELL